MPVPAPAEEQAPADVEAAAEQPDAAPEAGAGEGAASRPEPGSCVEVPESVSGLYAVADAGTAEVRREGDRLVVGPVAPAEGWTFEITEDDGDEVEIEFRRDGDEVDLEVEIDDGRVTVEICADDD